MSKKKDKQTAHHSGDIDSGASVAQSGGDNTAQNCSTATSSSEDNVKAVEQYIIELEAQVAKLTAELADSSDRVLRTAAEFDNFKKRTAKEKESIYNDVTAATILAVLPVMDNLERAVTQPGANVDALLAGMSMIIKQFSEIMNKIGVEKIEAVGTRFDPELHNAVMQVEVDGAEPNSVVEEFATGYKYKDKVIRHSMVKVSS